MRALRIESWDCQNLRRGRGPRSQRMRPEGWSERWEENLVVIIDLGKRRFRGAVGV